MALGPDVFAADAGNAFHGGWSHALSLAHLRPLHQGRRQQLPVQPQQPMALGAARPAVRSPTRRLRSAAPTAAIRRSSISISSISYHAGPLSDLASAAGKWCGRWRAKSKAVCVSFRSRSSRYGLSIFPFSLAVSLNLYVL